MVPEPPPVPDYDAEAWEVENFLKEYFQSQLGLSDTASLEMAQKHPINGAAFIQIFRRETPGIIRSNWRPAL